MKPYLLALLTIFCISSTFAQKDLRQVIDGANGLSKQIITFDQTQQVPFNPANASRTFGLDPNSVLVVKNTETDHLGITHYRYYQTYKGVPVENSMFIAHAKGGLLTAAGGAIVTDFKSQVELGVAEAISAQQAISASLQYVNAEKYAWQDPNFEQQLKLTKGSNATYYPTATKVWYSGEGQINPANLKLAFKVDVYSLKPFDRKFIYVDAKSGKILGVKPQMTQADATGTVMTGYSGEQAVHSDFDGTNYRLTDVTKGKGIYTFNGTYPYNDYLSSSASWPTLIGHDQWALDVHFGVAASWTFYKNNFNRNSIDNDGYKLSSVANDVNAPENAYWDGSGMHFGNLYSGNGVTAIDVVGHELTHGLTQFSSGLVYSREPGAINESISDIMGKSVQFYTKPNDVNWQLSNDMNWLIRDMSNPNLRGQPDTYNGTYWHSLSNAGDNYGVHVNSGVGNFMFYLLVAGGYGTNDLGNSYAVTGIGLAKADQIIYRTNVVYLTPMSDYLAWQQACISAATDLYGASSNEVTQVRQAWHAVGVGTLPCNPPVDLQANTADHSALLNWTAVPGSKGYSLQWKPNSAVNWYTVNVDATSYSLKGLTPGTAYSFRVANICNNSNLDFSPSVSFTTTHATAGLSYRYYEGSWTALPDFKALIPVKTGSSTNVDLSVRTSGRNDNYAFLWEGNINIPTAGEYTFETISDDGSKLYFNTLYNPNATALVNNDGLHYNRSVTGKVSVTNAGVYPITVTFFEQGGGELMQVYWSGPGKPRELIPNSAFKGAIDSSPPAAPSNLHAISLGHDMVSLDWDDASDNVGVIGYDVYQDGILKYSTIVSEMVVNNLTSATTYTLRVKARDFAGNTSAFSAPLTATTKRNVVLYGMTREGGRVDNGYWGDGTIFSYTSSPSAIEKVHEFTQETGVRPLGSVVQASDNLLYGMTSRGGAAGAGVIFSYAPASSTYKKLMDFTHSANSALYPTGGLIEVSKGTFYGMTPEGGSSGLGTIFSFSVATLTYTTVHNFDGFDGARPSGSLVKGSDGKLYGITHQGGSTGGGIIFSFSPSTGKFTNVHNFRFRKSAEIDGNLISATDGKLYGQRGDHYSGQIFSYSPSVNGYTEIYDFKYADGMAPGGSLVQASDGQLYGVTSAGGNNNLGVLFSFSPTTFVYKKLHDFITITGQHPLGSLVQASDGNLYGTTASGGSNGKGVVFSYSIITSGYTKLQDFNGSNGAHPQLGQALIEYTPVTENPQDTSTASGLTYRYYEGTWASLPNFNTLTPVKTGNSSNVDISLRTPGRNDNFAFLWEGNITIPTAGTYTFETISDDGSQLFFNSPASPTVNNDGLHAAVSKTGTVDIQSAGSYPIAISFFENGGGETIQVYWTGPGIPRQLIPNSAFTIRKPKVDTSAPTVPLNLKVSFVGQNSISLDWDNSTDNIGVTEYQVYVNGDQKYISATSDASINNLAPGTSYSFWVTARDLAGNTSAPSNLVVGTTKDSSSGSGLQYRYYEGTWNSLPNFAELQPVKAGTTANVDMSVRATGHNDNFAFLWEGNIRIPTAGTYTFETVSDDGSKLYFNSLYSPAAKATVNNDGIHDASTPAKGTVEIPNAGGYPIAITFFENAGGEKMEVYWSGPGIPRQLIPNSAFTPGDQPYPDSIAPTTPGGLKVVSVTNTAIHLDWDNATDNVGVTSYEISVRGHGYYITSNSDVIVTGLAANTSYIFGVKARDKAGNLSDSSTIIGTTSNTSAGLNYKYYEGIWSVLPDFKTLIPVKTGNSPNIDISVRPVGKNDNFAFLWEGQINIPTAGLYTFETISDDGSKLYINSTTVVNNDGLHAPVSKTGTVNIASAGSYPVAIAFFENSGGETMQVYWSGPGIARQLVPNSAFSGEVPPTDTLMPGGLNYRYYEGTWTTLPNFNNLTPVKTGNTPNIDITVKPAGKNDNFAFLWEGKINIPTAGTYTFETISDDGSQLFFNSPSAPTVNNDGIHPAVSKTGTVNIMAAGLYPIAISFFENSGGETIQVYWSGPGIARQLIPNSAFMRPANAGTNPVVQRQVNITDTAIQPGIGTMEIQKVYPNPFTERFNIDFYNSAIGNDINVGIYDLQGKLVYFHHVGTVPAGKSTLKVNLGGHQVPWGIYMIGLTINGIPSKMTRLVKAGR